MWKYLQNFTEKLPGCTSTDELNDALIETLADMGFEYYAFGNVYGDAKAMDKFPSAAISVNVPQEWVEYYFAHKLYEIDPAYLLAPYARRCLVWKEIKKYHPSFFEDAERFNLKAGVSLPLRSYDGCYVLSFASKSDFDISDSDLGFYEMLANQFFMKYLSIREIVHTGCDLSENQIYAIQYTMLGKRAKDIAIDLGKTSHGVYFMLDEARKKMECETVPQLIMKAVQQGLVVI